MKAGDKVRCIKTPPAISKECKPCPKVGWVYVIKAIGCFDDDGKSNNVGTKFGIELEGVAGKKVKRIFHPPRFFQLIPLNPVAVPRKQK